MKTPKLIKKAEQLLNGDSEKRREKKKSIKELLSKLKKKEHDLKEKLKTETDQKAAEVLTENLGVLFAQRKKGVAVLKEIKAQEKGGK